MEEKDELKNRLQDLDFLEPAKNKQTGGKFYICPLCDSGRHSNKTAAFSIKNDKPTQWKCFACDKGGDIFDLVAFKHNKNVRTSFKEVEALTREHLHMSAEKPKEERPIKKETMNYTDYIKQCKAFLLDGKHETAIDYLTGRGLRPDTLDRFDIGYDPRLNRIVIAYNDDTYYQTRSVNDEPGPYPKYINLTGVTPQIFNIDALYREQGQACFVVEGALCAMSLEQNGAGAIAIGGTNGIDRLINVLESKKTSKVLAIGLDNDEQGRAAQQKLVNILKQKNISFLEVSKEDYKGQKDFNDILRHDPDGLEDLCRRMENPLRYQQCKEFEEYSEKYNAARLADMFPIDIESAAEPIATGFNKLDDYLSGGLYPGLYVLGAVSSIGKTSLLVQMADSIAAAGNDVIYVSLEMASSELIAKSISRLTYTICLDNRLDHKTRAKDMRSLTSRKYIAEYTDKDRQIINQAKQLYQKYAGNISIIEGVSNMGVTDIIKKVETHEKLTGRKPVLIIDYLQIIPPDDSKTDVRISTDKTVIELKRLSRDKEIPVMVISSFSRAYYNKAVTMEAFKESGGIEFSADVLLGLQLYGIGEDNFNTKKAVQDNPRQMELVILKNRNGRRDVTVNLNYNADYSYFIEDDFCNMGKVLPLIETARREGKKVVKC